MSERETMTPSEMTEWIRKLEVRLYLLEELVLHLKSTVADLNYDVTERDAYNKDVDEYNTIITEFNEDIVEVEF